MSCRAMRARWLPFIATSATSRCGLREGFDAMQAALARWYADHSAIRRLWAIEDPLALIVFIALEPTSDGDDTLPLWFAHQSNWRSDLEVLIRREVQLKLIVPGAFAEP